MKDWKRTFTIIWTGELLSILTSTVVSFALIIWLSLKTESAEVLAWATLASLLPHSLLGLVTGVFVDRWNRKLTMMLADSFIAVCTLLLALLFTLGIEQIWQVYLLLSLRSVGAAFHAPAMHASIPMLAPLEKLTKIAGVNQVINSVSNIAGPAIAALLLGVLDISVVLMFDVVGALIACTCLMFVKIPNPERKEERRLNILEDLKEAWVGVKSVKKLLLLFLLSTVATLVIMPVSALFPLMTLKHFLGTPLQMSIVEAAWGAGMLLGGIILGVMSTRINKVFLINSMYLLLGTSFFASGLLPAGGYVWFVILSLIGGASGSIYTACFTVIVQTRIAPEMLGRVFSAYVSISLLPSMFGLLFTGVIADVIGVGNAFVISGVVIFLVGIVSFFFRDMLRLGRISY